jgi:hypothetical protein
MPPDFIYELPPVGIFLTVLAGTGVIAFIFSKAVSLRRLKRVNEQLSDLSPVIMTLCGTLFVLSVTFLANMVWMTEDRARETVNTEARSIRVMEDYMAAMTGPARDGLTRMIEDYGRSVAAEWKSMHVTGGSLQAEQSLKDIYSAIIRGFAEGEQNRLMQQRLLIALDQLSTARQQRLSMAQDVVSAGQWFLVSALGVLLLAMIAIGHARFGVPRTVALTAITLAVSIALFVIIAHDRPFVGYNAVGPYPILYASGLGG